MRISLTYILLLTVAIGISNCQNDSYEYTLSNESGGIYVEQFNNSIIDDNRYTQGNIVYKDGNKYRFNYQHIKTNKDSLLFNLQLATENWVFCAYNKLSDTTVSHLEMVVQSGREPFLAIDSNYNQTIIRYSFLNKENSTILQQSRTGVIDNEKNIWIHPPRTGYFKILEINPFPYIQAPYVIGNTWDWSLGIGSHWGDERWRTWRTSIRNNYHYEITDISNRNTAFGDIECYEITSTGTGELGETKLVSWFNFEYGFVKLDYTNIDSSKTIINLTEFEKGSPSTY